MRQLLSFFALALLTLIACTTPAILTPPNGPDQVWTCRPQEHDCGNGACCDDSTICGGGQFNPCPTGMCCPADTSGGVGATQAYPQRPKVAN